MVTVDETTISPAGDPFTANTAPAKLHEDRDDVPHGCYAGWVYLGHVVDGEDGEELEVFEPVRCRRCSDSR